jgi:hypothetical protein
VSHYGLAIYIKKVSYGKKKNYANSNISPCQHLIFCPPLCHKLGLIKRGVVKQVSVIKSTIKLSAIEEIIPLVNAQF